ncbi:MAG TPA: hypothetical protein VGP12_09585 [Nitrosospira sp.]|jgi:hypothetical protein|nr:hypothetical protein [Nitrosospira sp.]
MWILLLEAAVALSLLILIVWWTRPSRPHTDEEENDKNDAEPK